MSKDYYKILGVEKNASQDEIKKAFRKMAHQHHPDKQGGNADKFKEANEAYSVLSDEGKRKQYDTFGSAGPQQGGFGGGQGGFGGFDFSGFQGQGGFQDVDLGDIFGDFFGGGRSQGRGRAKRGNDISVDIEISFADSIFGTDKTIEINKVSNCSTCEGTGAKKGSKMKTCSTCQGHGKISEVKRTILGSFAQERVCDACHGKGKIPEEKCTTCHGAGVHKRKTEIEVSIPAGIDNGETMRLTGAGEAISGGTPGDLYIKLRVQKHAIWKKNGDNLTTELPIKLSEALLGTTRKLSTLDGDIDLKIPEGITHGEVLRVRGKGVPVSAHARGDLFITILIDLPRKLSKEARKAVEVLRAEGI